jgi:hypothetical protein
MAQNERPPLVLPIVLIVVGALFLYGNYHPLFYPWEIIKTYWPLMLIFVGLAKIWDSSHRGQGSDPQARQGSTALALLGVVVLVLVLAALFSRGRVFSRERHFAASSLHHEVRTVELQNAKTVNASLNASAGELTIGGGSSHLLDADFSFSDSYSDPRVDYNVASGVGRLEISQDDRTTHFGTTHNEWNLRFSNEVPLELKIDMGAGQGRLRLRDVPVTRLDLNMGAGQVDIDLTGDRNKDLAGDIEGGVGQATIRLPKDVGVIVHASGGIGAVGAHGFKHDGDEYTNDAYGKTPATIHLKVQGGVGEISLILEP